MKVSEIDIQRKNLDAEIEVLETRTRDLKTKRNTLAPISNLPNELLCRIMVDCRGEWPYIDDEGTTTWLAVTHVCHAWRAIALDYPQLWCKIDADLGHQWMETFLSRSKGLHRSLRVSQGWEDEYSVEDLETLSSIIEDRTRLETVKIELRGDTFHGLVEELKEATPNLVHLTVHNDSSDGFVLPSPLLANHAPQLRTL
jgi:F-box-like